MIVEHELKRLYNELAKTEVSNIHLAGANVTVRMFDQYSKVALSAQVYHGSNFIPKSVRECLSQSHPFGWQDIKTFLTLDENAYQINLNYVGTMDTMSRQKFIAVLEEFSLLADKWQSHLDDHDKRDLIHVRVK